MVGEVVLIQWNLGVGDRDLVGTFSKQGMNIEPYIELVFWLWTEPFKKGYVESGRKVLST